MCLGGPPFPRGRPQVESDGLDLSSRLVKTRLASPQFACSLIQGFGMDLQLSGEACGLLPEKSLKFIKYNIWNYKENQLYFNISENLM